MKPKGVLVFDDLKRLLHHSVVYSIGNVAMRAGAFVLLPLYTRHLTIAEYGILELLYSVSSLVSSFLGIGLAHAILRFYFEYDDQDDRNLVVTTGYISSFILTVPILFFLSFFNLLISETVFDSPLYITSLNLVYLTIVFEMARQIGLSYMRAREYSVFFVIVCCFQLVIQVGANIYTVAFMKKGVEGILLGNMFSVFCGMVLCTILIVRDCGFGYQYSKLKELLSYSYPFLFTAVSSAILQNADRFILKAFLSLDAVGAYGLALKFGLLLKELVVEPFQRSFGAFRFSIMKQDNASDIQARTMNYLLFIVSWCGLVIALFANEIITLFATSAYEEVGYLVPIVVLGQVVASCSYLYQTGILYKKKTKYLFYISFVSGVAGILFSVVLIKMFFTIGACCALCVQALVVNKLTNVVSQKLYPIRFENYKIFLAVLILCGAGSFAFFLTEITVTIILIKFFILIMYPVVLISIKYFTKEELQLVVGFVREKFTLLKNRVYQ